MKQLFELEMLGGTAERSYRKLRPGVDDLPWDTLRASDYAPALVDAARTSWTEGAYSEYCTAAAFSELLRALLEARAPLDLIGMAGDFVADEMLHTELNARMAMVLGGARAYQVDFEMLTPPTVIHDGPRMRAAELAVRYCCVGEALSVPLLGGTMRAASHPLTRLVLERIVKDEGPHAQLGWCFLDWADGWLSDGQRAALGRIASDALARYADECREPDRPPAFEAGIMNAMGWMQPAAYAALARQSVQRSVVTPLARYGIVVDASVCTQNDVKAEL